MFLEGSDQIRGWLHSYMLEICGTRGKIVLENNKLTFTRNDADMIEFSKTSKSGFAKPEVWTGKPGMPWLEA